MGTTLTAGAKQREGNCRSPYGVCSRNAFLQARQVPAEFLEQPEGRPTAESACPRPGSVRGPPGVDIASSTGSDRDSLFRSDSALSRLNADGRLDDPPQAPRDMLALSDALHRQTEGLFDPTVQPPWRALVEGGDAAQACGLTGWGRVRLGDRIEIGSGQSLTLNGLAQGYAADRIRNLLAEAGYGPALVDMGNLRRSAVHSCLGSRPLIWGASRPGV